jgi:hypothetical protein
MRNRSSVWFAVLFALAALASCGGGSDSGSGQSAALSWFTTCGDPVCGGYRGPFPGVPLCSTEKAGDMCTVANAECDLKDSCNTRLRCADADPKQQPGGCPISRAAFKRDIRYLEDAQRAELLRELQALRLATYRYKDAGPAAAPRLGFLIDDVQRSGGSVATLAVDAQRDQVDLYGYVSMAVAALQAQAQQIEALRAEVRQLQEAMRQRDHASGKMRTSKD